jgi:hypothetical protein
MTRQIEIVLLSNSPAGGMRIAQEASSITIEMAIDYPWEDVVTQVSPLLSEGELEQLRSLFEDPDYRRSFTREGDTLRITPPRSAGEGLYVLDLNLERPQHLKWRRFQSFAQGWQHVY